MKYLQRHGSIGYMNAFPDLSGPGFDVQEYNRRFHDANVIIDAQAKSIFYDKHWGPLSIKCAFNGQELYKSGDAMYRVDDSNLLIFNEGKYYESWIDSQSEVESMTLNMTPAFERDAIRALRSSQTGRIDDCGGEERIRFTERLYSHCESISPLLLRIRMLARDVAIHHGRIQELFFSLYIEMVRLQGESDREALATGKVRAGSRVELYRRLLLAKDFLHSCFHEEVTLDKLASISYLNPYYLLREFKKVFGATPHQYLTQLRMAEAARMLTSDGCKVESVCRAVGFEDATSFGKLFRRYSGLTPTAYRAMRDFKAKA
jgi:AraC family transcriptional regulator